MAAPSPRLAVRGLLVVAGRLLLVNAYADHRRELWCAPGGGVEPHASLHDNLIRELHEECGLDVVVGDLALVNEFHHEPSGFHQVEMFFHLTLAPGASPDIAPDWQDPDHVVNLRRWFTRDAADAAFVKPSSLVEAAFNPSPARYDPLEIMVR